MFFDKKKFTVLFYGIVINFIFVGISELRAEKNSNVGVEKRQALKDTERIFVRGPIRVIIQQGAQESLVIRADEKIAPLVKVHSSGKQLFIAADGVICDDGEIVCHITVKNITEIDLIGVISCNIMKYKSDRDVSVRVSGRVNLKATMCVPALSMIVHGRGQVVLSGKVIKQDIVCTGGATYNARNLRCETARVNVGTSYLELAATQLICGIQSGGSTIAYTRNPKIEVKSYSSCTKIAKG